jgi:hypothetical protein
MYFDNVYAIRFEHGPQKSKNDLLEIHFKARVYFLLLLQSYFVVLLLCLL